jgi:nitrous oxidase accessory protein NosD
MKAILCMAVGALALAGTAFAAQRTFVASYGTDANPCSVTQPCRGFAAAILQADAGGEVVVLDSGGYGPVTIGKSISLIAPEGVYAGISVLDTTPGLRGIVINAGPSGRVTLRGLSLASVGTAPSKVGVDVQSAAHVRIERCTLDGFSSGISSVGNAAKIAVTDTTIRGSDDGTGSMGAAIGVTGTYDARLVVARVIVNNMRTGVYVGGLHHAEVLDTTIGYSVGHGIRAESFAGQPDNGSLVLERVALLESYAGLVLHADAPRQMVANVRNSTISGNEFGVYLEDGGYVRLAGTQITANHTAIVKTGGGILYSFGDNLCAGNDAPCIAATPIGPW